MAYRLPPLNALRAFEAAARHTSFKQAAHELNVTPAAVSHQVKALEEILGVALFKRLPRGLVPTDAARAFLPELSKGFAHLGRAARAVEGGSLSGPLKISMLPSFANCWLVPRLHGFVEGFPDIDLSVVGEVRQADFSREDVDLAIRYGKGGYPGLHKRLLMTEEAFPVCAPGLLNASKPLRRLADLRHHTLLHDFDVAPVEASLIWSNWLREAGLDDADVAGNIRFNDAVLVMDAAVRGLGVALAKRVLAADHLAAGRLVRPFAASRPAELAYYAVMPEGNQTMPKVRVFLQWLQEQCAQEAS